MLLVAGTLLAAPLAPEPALAHPLAPQFHGVGVVRTILSFGVARLGDEFEPADEPLVFGLGVDVREPAAELGFETGLFYNLDDADQDVPGAGTLAVETEVWEIYLGGGWTFDPWLSRLKPHAGVGLSALYARFDASGLGGSSHESGWAFGLYGHVGLDWDFGGGWSVGIDVRGLVSTEASLQEDVPLDYVHGVVTLGWAW